MRFKLDQAMRMHRRLVFKQFFKDWKIVILKESKLNKHLISKLQRKFRVFFKFWRWMSAAKHTKRQRELLAEVMGCYSIKARTFARIKLFIYQNKKVCCYLHLTLLAYPLTYVSPRLWWQLVHLINSWNNSKRAGLIFDAIKSYLNWKTTLFVGGTRRQ